MPSARRLVRTMQAGGAHTALVSGGFDIFAAIVANACGFDEYHANHLVIADGKLAGLVAEPILDREGKAKVLRRLAADLRRHRIQLPWISGPAPVASLLSRSREGPLNPKHVML